MSTTRTAPVARPDAGSARRTAARPTTTRERRPGTAILANVVLLTMIAPLATDMYVPAFPLVGRDLDAGASSVQLTLTTFFVGMALGQLLGGPISDQRGRRGPLLIAVATFLTASVVCAMSPSIGVMWVARFVQGMSGGWAMVIARSLVVDLNAGPGLVRSLNLVQGVAGLAPIVGPLMGALLLERSGWRISFWVLAAGAIAMLVSVALTVPETLPAEQRHTGGLRQLRSSVGRVLAVPAFVGYLVVMALSMGVIFAYVATSAYVLQSMNGLSPVTYAVVFAINAVGLTVATFVAARLAGRVPTRGVIGAGLAASAAAGLLLLVGALWFAMPLWMALGGFFVLLSAQGLVGPNAGAMASSQVPDDPGTGSAVLGFLQWCSAGLVAPLAGLGGDRTAVPMAVIVLALVVVSLAALVLARRDGVAPSATADTTADTTGGTP